MLNTRSVSTAVVCLAALAWSFPAVAAEPSAGPFTVGNYQLVSSKPVSRTVYEFEYKASVTNAGTLPATNVTGTVQSANPSLQIVTNALTWNSVGAGQTVASANTFKFRFDRTKVFQSSDLVWTVNGDGPQKPTANAGPNQAVTLGDLVHLNGSGSSDPQGLSLSYAWSFSSQPPSCGAVLSGPTSVMPTFTASCVGTFTVQLIVTNTYGLASAPSFASISTSAVPPTANAGPDQNISLTQTSQTVFLNGSASQSPGGLPLTYKWTLTTKPANSATQLGSPSSVTPSFVPDKVGAYHVQLIVNNGYFDSAADEVVVTTDNVAPTANAGPDQSVNVAALVQLNGSASTDANSLPLTFAWSLTAKPEGSTAVLNNAAAVNPTFTADKPGNYIVQLIVANPYKSSAADTVTISTEALAPTANAGPDQTVAVGTTVTLTGAGSSDPQNLPLTYAWTLTSKPSGSAATLTGASSVSPSFLADRAGQYVARLVVSNGFLSSTEDTVLISTTAVAPTANAGPDQNVQAGAVVQLNGNQSESHSGYPLTYTWSFTAKPEGSLATLTNANTPTPIFTADLPGLYVVQLIVNDSLQNSAPDTVQITAEAQKTISLSTTSQSLLTQSTTTVTLTLSGAAPAGGVIVDLGMTGTPVQIPASVTVPAGATGVNFTLSSGVAAGTLTVTASSSGYTAASLAFTINNRAMTLTTSNTLVGVGRSIDGTLTLTNPAPASGAVINVSSSNGTVTLSTSTLTFAEGETVKTFTINGVSAGSATLTASGSGFSNATRAVTCTAAIVNLPANLTVGVGQSVPYPVSLGAAAPTGGLMISLNSGDSSIASVSPATVTVAQGQTSPSTLPNLTGVKSGAITVTATAPNYVNGSGNVLVQNSLSFSPQALTIPVTNSKTLTLGLSAPAPSGGYAVTLSSSDPSKATVPSSVVIPAGQSQVDLSVTAVAIGTATITASASGANSGTAAITVIDAPAIVLNYPGEKIGKDLQMGASLSLAQPAPAGNLAVTLTSNNANLKLSTSATTAGSASITVTVPAGQVNSSIFILQNTGATSGTASLTASAPGYATATATVGFERSGWYLPYPLTPGSPVYVGQPPFSSAATVVALDADGQPELSGQTLRAGHAPVTLSLSSSNTAVATIDPAATVNPGESTAYVNTAVVGIGSATISLATPAGFTKPASQTSYTLSVSLPPITASLEVGYNLQATLPIYLPVPAPEGGLDFTFTRQDSKIALSTDQSALGGASATVHVDAGGTYAGVWVQNLGQSSGSTNITLTAPGYAPSTIPITLSASGFSAWNGNIGQLTTQSAPLELVLTGLNASGVPQPLRPGITVSVPLANSNQSAVSVTTPVSCSSASCKYVLTPLAAGTAEISVLQPNGYTEVPGIQPQSVEVISAGFWYSGGLVGVGKNLIYGATFFVSNVPAQDLQVTASSNNSNLRLSLDPLTPGSPSVTLTVGAGNNQLPIIYLHNMGVDSGSAKLTLTAPGYASDFDVPFLRAGVAIDSAARTVYLLGPPLQSSIYTYADVGGYALGQPPRPGVSIDVQLTSSTPGIVSFTQPIQIGAAGYTVFDVVPVATGSTTLSVVQPQGYYPVDGYVQQQITVGNPTFRLGSAYGAAGRNLQDTLSLWLDVPAPSGGLTVTVTSNNAGLRVSKDPSAAGSASIQVLVPEGENSFTLYAQNVNVSSGVAKISLSAPGYDTQVLDEALYPSAFSFVGDSFGASVSGDAISLPLYATVLDPVTLNVWAVQSLRGGFSQPVNLNSTNPSVVSVISPATFLGGASTVGVLITPKSAGTSVLAPIQPSGYSTPSNYQSLTVNVVP